MRSREQIPHIIIASVEAWGHARPLCAFASRVVHSRDVHVTLFTVPRILNRMNAEISRSFGTADADRQKFIRVISLDTKVETPIDGKPFGEIMKEEQSRYYEVFMAAYQKLLDERPVSCAVTNVEFPVVPAPKVVLVDFMVGPLAGMIKKVNSQSQVIGFCSGMASFVYISFAPTDKSGRVDFEAKVKAAVKETGRPIHDVAEEMAHNFTDDVLEIPGFPKMHHWEFDPQDTKWLTKGFIGSLWLALLDTYIQCDGMMLTSPEAYEPAAIIATREWFSLTNRSIWAIGPILPSITSVEAMAGEGAQSESSGAIKKFMNETLATHGEHSMLYVSFGSIFWPPSFEKVEIFVDVLIERKIPFIFSHGSPTAQLTDEFKGKVQDSGVGLLSRWSPQQTILSHPALGWFVTHCGHNSTLEAVSSGVPMICWPFHADQPANAVNLTEVHRVAYELFEVRTGNGLKPIYRTGRAPLNTVNALKAEVNDVLDKAFGEDGQKKRANVKNLKRRIDTAWDEGGSAAVDMGKFLAIL
ncbi:UDP-Glycosyltransferase/glycogen phosphorylase [Cristinia sonorae]|uniref:UDP-Glycosyltransferase/glycogen phosphorylase n=1 Tax=Cristinia sonorae TaxID=1940300 RepID=A0A8K0UUZ4_9AGAR|nr:UDP-Glycosyltransferase/glycogen phosphorylase [Cristinia sonorae]